MRSESGLEPSSAAAESLAAGFPLVPSAAATACARLPLGDLGKLGALAAHSFDSEALKELCHTGVSCSGTGSSGTDAALALIAQRTLEITSASGVAIGLYAGEEVLCRARAGAAPDVGTRLERNHGLSGECLQTGQLVHCADAANDPRVDAVACRALNLRSAVAVPICCDGRVLGVFDVFSAEANFFDDHALLILDQVANLVAQIVAPPSLTSETSSDTETMAEVAVTETAVPHTVVSPGPASPTAAAAKTFGRMVLSEYFLIALVIVALAASVLGSYRTRKRARAPVLDVTRGLVEKTVPEQSSTGPAPVPADPEAPRLSASHDGSSAPNRNPAKREPESVHASQPVANAVSQGVILRQPETRLEPPVLAIPESQQETIVGVIQAPAADPTLAQELQPAPSRPGKPKRLSRALNGAKKPAKFFFGKNPKKDPSAGAAPEPSQPFPAPQPSN